MKICFIIGSMSFSGAEKVLSIIAKELKNKNNDVSLILLEQRAEKKENFDGIITYGAKSEGNKLKRIMLRWKYIRKNVRMINPDIVISFGFVCNVNMLPALRGLRIPKIICERNDPDYDPRKLSERFARWLLYREADGYVFQTERIKKFFSTKIQNKSTVIPNPIIKSGVTWNVDNTSKSVVTVARLDDFQKDHSTMFKAFQKFHERHPDYTLDVYGDGPDKEKYQKIIDRNGMSSSIILHGKCANPLSILLSSEIFLLTSKFEGMPNALMEAMSIGMPCISTDCGGGGAQALFKMCDSGILVDVGDTDAIANQMDRLINDRAQEMEMSTNALRINKVLDKEKVTDLWINFFSDTISKFK